MKKSVEMYNGGNLSSQFLEEEDEVDLIQIFHDIKTAVINNKKLAITIFLVINTIFFISAKIENKNSRYIRTVVQLDYDHANEGLNFDGTKFMKDKLINGAILSSLYKSYNLGENFEDNIDNLKQAITIEGVVPSDIKYISDMKLKAGEIYRYTPIQYTIIFKYGN